MIYFFFGSDNLRQKRRVLELEKKYFKTSGDLNISHFEGEVDLEKIRAEILAIPFLSPKRMIVLRNLLRTKPDEKKLSSILDQTPDSSILVIAEDGPIDKRLSVVKRLLKEKWEVFDLPQGYQLERWVAAEAEILGGKIGQREVSFLINWLGATDLWQIKNELGKLIAYDPIITEATITNLSQPSSQVNVFNLIDAIFSQKKKAAFFFLEKLRQKGENDLLILAMIEKQIRNLTLVWELKKQGKSEPETARELKIHPYVIKKALGTVSKISSLDTFRKYYHQVVVSEEEIKSGAKEAEVALDILIAQFCTRKP